MEETDVHDTSVFANFAFSCNIYRPALYEDFH